jgi:hypothetical protein
VQFKFCEKLRKVATEMYQLMPVAFGVATLC